MAITRNPQTHLDEKPLNNPALAEQLQLQSDFADDASQFNKAKREAKKIIKALRDAGSLPDGMYRCGEFSIIISSISGGNITIEPWESVALKFREPDTE